MEINGIKLGKTNTTVLIAFVALGCAEYFKLDMLFIISIIFCILSSIAHLAVLCKYTLAYCRKKGDHKN